VISASVFIWVISGFPSKQTRLADPSVGASRYYNQSSMVIRKFRGTMVISSDLLYRTTGLKCVLPEKVLVVVRR
jgi:hypothetical protein